VESVGRASCAESDQASKLVSCDNAVDVATQASIHKRRDMHDQTCDTILVTVRHKQANMERRGKNISPPNQGGTVERISCP